MNILFVTGSDSAFFNSLLVCLQSFAERLPGHRLLVCDYGLTNPQAKFLRGLGVLLERPPILSSRGVFHCKAGLVHYLHHDGYKIEGDNAVVWLDADITLMKVGIGDFAAVIANMTSVGADVAACGEPGGRSVGQVATTFVETSAMAPFARTLAQVGIDARLPYFSSGLFFCRSTGFLSGWDEMTAAVDPHPLFEQNMFNVALYREAVPVLALDCDEWQAQGHSLDRIELDAAAAGGRPAARIGCKNIKTLHVTSPAPGHLLIAECRFRVREFDLIGPFKLFLAEPLRMHQLQLLARFVAVHGEALLRLGLCTRVARPIEGFEFVTL
jgi:hypothetical protein